MKTNLGVTWVLELDADEARIVIAALRGTLKPHQLEKALAMANDITQDRASHARNLSKSMDKHEDNMNKVTDE